MRGKPVTVTKNDVAVRITPAHAGKTGGTLSAYREA